MRNFILAALISVAAVSPVYAAKPPIYVEKGSNLAVSGYDPVAYFKDGKPSAGNPAYTTTHQGLTWRFASAANRDAFVANPGAYAPQYGGYCAYAVSQNGTAEGDPKRWKIVDGKLYLNANWFAQRLWENGIPDHIVKANKNWPHVLDK
jgi:hypothetical protein